MKKPTLFLILIFLGLCPVFSQTSRYLHDSISTVSCVFEDHLSYDSAIYIPDGPSCTNLPDCYSSYITFSSFPNGSVITSASDLSSLCIKMEHSALGDLLIRLICPDGSSMIIHSQPNGGGLDMGIPVIGSDSCSPNALHMGETWNYCWSDNPQFTYHGAYATHYIHQDQANSSCDSSNRADNSNFYHPMNSFSSIIGCPMNGSWGLEVCDLYATDDGWVSGWDLQFNQPNNFATGGRVFFDSNENCQQDSNETGIPNRTVTIQPNGITLQTNALGYWWADGLPFGSYSLTIDTTGYLLGACPQTLSFSVADSGTTMAPCVGLISIPSGIKKEQSRKDNVATIYPNPSNGKFMIEGSEELTGEPFSIYDYTGRLLKKGILTSQKTLIDIEPYPQGIYFLKIGLYQKDTLKIAKN
jgi:subtilisin-like proprotein convertase family protein